MEDTDLDGDIVGRAVRRGETCWSPSGKPFNGSTIHSDPKRRLRQYCLDLLAFDERREYYY
jgi:hypothetical protein